MASVHNINFNGQSTVHVYIPVLVYQANRNSILLLVHVCFKLILYCFYRLFSYIFRDNSPLSTSYEVRVLDLDRPWEAYVVTDSLSGISNLVWDRTGHRLLVTGLDGSCSVWEMEVIYWL